MSRYVVVVDYSAYGGGLVLFGPYGLRRDVEAAAAALDAKYQSDPEESGEIVVTWSRVQPPHELGKLIDG